MWNLTKMSEMEENCAVKRNVKRKVREPKNRVKERWRKGVI